MNINEKIIELDKKLAAIFNEHYITSKNLSNVRDIYKKSHDLFTPEIFHSLEENKFKRFYAGIYLQKWRTLNNYFYYPERIRDDMFREKELLNGLGFKDFIDYYEYVTYTSVEMTMQRANVLLERKDVNRFKQLIPGEYIKKLNIYFEHKFDLKIELTINEAEDTPYCIPVSIPEDIILFVPGLKNKFQLDKYLHEIGHYIHFSKIDYDNKYEDKVFGDYGVAEGFALLFESLNDNGLFFNDAEIIKDYSGTIKNENRILSDQLKILTNTINFYTERVYEEYVQIDHELNSAMYIKGYIFKNNLLSSMNENWITNEFKRNKLVELMRYGYKFDYTEEIN